MPFALVSAKKDLLRLARDPLALLVWVGIPLLIGSLMTLATGGRSGPSPKARVLVADHDEGILSDFLVGALSQDRAGAFATAEEVCEDEGRARMQEGEATALLVIPAGFTEAVLREQPTELVLVENPAQTILPGMVEEALSILSDGVFYLHRLLGPDLARLYDEPPSDARIAAFSVRVRRIVERVQDLLFPPAIELVRPEAGEPAPDTGGLALAFVPGLLVMSLLFISQGLAEDLWRERAQATLRRLTAAPRSIHSFLLGKILAGALAMTLVSLTALAAAFAYFDVPAGRLLPATGWAILSGLWLLGAMMLVQLAASSQRAAGILSLALIFPLMMVGGSFFPFDAMPDWMAAIGRRTPNGWSVTVLTELVNGSPVGASWVPALAGLAASGALIFFVVARALRAAVARG